MRSDRTEYLAGVRLAADARPALRWGLAAVRLLGAVLGGLWWFCRSKPLGAIGAFIVLAMLLMAAFAETVAPYGYDDSIRGARMVPPGFAHWLGTDNLSRDLWSRIVYGARISLAVGFGTILLGTLVATVIGVLSGYSAQCSSEDRRFSNEHRQDERLSPSSRWHAHHGYCRRSTSGAFRSSVFRHGRCEVHVRYGSVCLGQHGQSRDPEPLRFAHDRGLEGGK
jgi:hypothetical protein